MERRSRQLDAYRTHETISRSCCAVALVINKKLLMTTANCRIIYGSQSLAQDMVSPSVSDILNEAIGNETFCLEASIICAANILLLYQRNYCSDFNKIC